MLVELTQVAHTRCKYMRSMLVLHMLAAFALSNEIPARPFPLGMNLDLAKIKL